jgi:hypothetical protein
MRHVIITYWTVQSLWIVTGMQVKTTFYTCHNEMKQGLDSMMALLMHTQPIDYFRVATGRRMSSPPRGAFADISCCLLLSAYRQLAGFRHERVLANTSALPAFWSGVICLGRGALWILFVLHTYIHTEIAPQRGTHKEPTRGSWGITSEPCVAALQHCLVHVVFTCVAGCRQQYGTCSPAWM